MVKITKIDESYVKVHCNDDIALNLALAFSTMAKGYEFDQKYRSGIWDGRIYQYNYTNDTIPLGLTFKLSKYLKHTLNIDVTIDESIFVKADLFSDEYITDFIKNTIGHTQYDPYDYQLQAIREIIYHRRLTIVCATGSGKSFIMFVAVCMILYHYTFIKTILVITPNVGLVNQLISDFDEYSRHSDNTFSKAFICNYRDKKPNTTNPIHVTNYQQICKRPTSFFNKFDMVMADECHNVSNNEVKNFAKCSLNSINAVFKIGLCGKMSEDKTLRLNCEGIFGPIKTIREAYELIQSGQLSKFKAIAITLKYSEDRRHEFYRWINDKSVPANKKYQMETEFLNAQNDRRQFICKLAVTRKHNTLILVTRRPTSGNLIYEELKKMTDKTVFYVHGGIKAEEREKIRKYANLHNNIIIVATMRTFSIGINIKNLHNIILAESIKGEIQLIQLIGRELRLHKSKDIAILYDISDDLRLSSNHQYNYSLRHLISRISIYDNDKLDYETTTYTL
jgi:superfamily II DNA or RNA helicase